MATVYVVCAPADEAFVVERVLADLPLHGLDCWVGARHIAGGDIASIATEALAQALRTCAVVLVAVSPALAASAFARADAKASMASGRPVVAVEVSAMEEADWSTLPDRLRTMAVVDWGLEGDDDEARRLLAGLLPTLLPADSGATVCPIGQPIRWSESRYSEALARATGQHDHTGMVKLAEVFVRHAAGRNDAYPADSAVRDLTALRRERAFVLMCRYGEAATATGTRDAGVRRLLAQGLIETRRFDEALGILKAITQAPDTSPEEQFEALGLVGRVNKQRYVESLGVGSSASSLLSNAIDAYGGVYDRDATQVWHGVNAASCIRRAARDGVPRVDAARAQRIAEQVLATIDARPGPIAVWDAASRVEALVALERHADAEAALETYLQHPDMTAFEALSTHRQFEQVLQLGRDPRASKLLHRLSDTVKRYRASTVAESASHVALAPAESAALEAPGAMLRPLVIRASTTTWEPNAIADLVIRSRLGTVVTARGSERSVRELLTDPGVISVEESRPAGSLECARSMPFIRIAEEYAAAGGPYREAGDGALVAVIDNGIDVLHKAFLGADGQSRIVGIWDQNATGSPPPGFDYGHFHDAAAVAGYVKAQQVPPSLSRNERGHGTHVASIAVGRAAGEGEDAFAGGVAPEARLLVVISGGAGPIGYSQSHVEALAFIDAMARQLRLPVVVNLSQGMNAGAHDGKSPLEVAFDAFSASGTAPGRVIVKSAGNERAKGGHAKVTLLDGGIEKLAWRRSTGADFFERLELWWSSSDTMRMRLGDPAGAWSDWVGSGAKPKAEGAFAKSGSYSITFVRRHVDNGDSLLAIDLGSASKPAAIGEWQLEIECLKAPESGVVHAWLERTQGVPSSFTGFDDPEVTLSIPGTAASVIAVGAVDARMPLRLGEFSSFGPTRDGQKKPLVCAPGVAVRAARGGTAHDTFVDNGTSMAAPHISGAIALLLSRAAKSGIRLAANQVASALRGKTQNYNGRWDRGQGYGVVDVAALLGTLDD